MRLAQQRRSVHFGPFSSEVAPVGFMRPSMLEALEEAGFDMSGGCVASRASGRCRRQGVGVQAAETTVAECEGRCLHGSVMEASCGVLLRIFHPVRGRHWVRTAAAPAAAPRMTWDGLFGRGFVRP